MPSFDGCEVRPGEEQRTAGAKRQQKHGTAFLHNQQPSTRRFAPLLTHHPDPFRDSFRSSQGLYVTPTLQGSRSGATIAAAWSSVLYKGENGYLRMAKSHNDTMTKAKVRMTRSEGWLKRNDSKTITPPSSITKNLPIIASLHASPLIPTLFAIFFRSLQGIINKIDGLDLLVEPEGCILPLVPSPGSKLDIYLVASQMEKKGWNLFTGQSPAVLGLCVGDVHLKMLDAWEVRLDDDRSDKLTTLESGMKITHVRTSVHDAPPPQSPQ